MRVITSMRGLLLFLALTGLSCVSAQLETSPDHPASPSAPVAPASSVGALLTEANPAVPSAPSDTTAPAAAPDPGAHAGHGEPGHGAHAAPEAPEGAGTADAPAPDPQKKQWTCPMHPEIVRSEPGNCPICGMKLVPVKPKQEP